MESSNLIFEYYPEQHESKDFTMGLPHHLSLLKGADTQKCDSQKHRKRASVDFKLGLPHRPSLPKVSASDIYTH